MSIAYEFVCKVHPEEFVRGHLQKVVGLVARIIHLSEDIPEDDKTKLLQAAWLHDYLEDVEGASYQELVDNFGEDVANLCVELTKTDDNTFPNLKTKYAYIIKYADRTCNLLHRVHGKNELANADKYFMKSIFWKV
jgi:(p)ppGpp synthase/HD superfamily hydrolase